MRTETLVRQRLRETFPVGTHRFTDAIDSDGHGTGPLHIRFALTRTPDDRFIFDASETDDQAPGPVNYLMNRDVPGTAFALYFLGGDPSQVVNAGGARAFDEIILREGSLLRPRFPAPLGMRGMTMMRVLATLNGLINVAGTPAPAAHAAYVILLIRGTADGKPFLLSDGLGVGYGARPDADGIDSVYFVAQEIYPVEFLELGYPVVLNAYSVHRDSGGPGRFRGGCGVVREYTILAEQSVLAVRIDSVVNPPWGAAGGLSGGVARAVVNPGRPDERVLPPRENVFVAPADGLVVSIEPAVPPAELGMGETPRMRVAIFLSVLDVHVNRAPIGGVVRKIAYHAGKFLSAAEDKASEENERNALLLALPGGQEVAVVQIAGLIARRILCEVAEGQTLKAGERFGIIRFGSRTDLYLPEGCVPLVAVGQRTIGGETVIAELAPVPLPV
ncbi:MAG: phosphatidylserine decarboxylase [Acidocella sp. 20-63-7]|nr:MAG: phosphatidylserine decarboxylase [Acidocella sp. 20-63-7]